MASQYVYSLSIGSMSIWGEQRAKGEGISTTKFAKISLNPLMGGLVRERKCSLVASGELLRPRSKRVPVCGRVFFGANFLFLLFGDATATLGGRWTHLVRERGDKKRTKDDSGCMYIGWETVLLLLHARGHCSCMGVF